MNLVQTLRRLGQQMKGWSESARTKEHQFLLLKKFFSKNGLELRMTCGACPEQYEVFNNGKQVAYFRLRHGEFRVDYPDCGGETIYEACPVGDGIFNDDERLVFMYKAMKAVLTKITVYPV